MSKKKNQPREFDAVLGGETSPPATGVVLGGIEGFKRRFKSEDEEVRIATLNDALNYGDEGLDFVIETLEDDSQRVQHSVALFLKSLRNEKGKQALLNYNPSLYFTKLEDWETKKFNINQGIVFPFGTAYVLQNKNQFKALVQDPLAKRVEALKCYIVDKNLHRRKHLQDFFDDIVEAKDFLPNLKALFIGSPENDFIDINIYISNILPILKAYPVLELFQVRGNIDNANFLKSNIETLTNQHFQHNYLKSLIIHAYDLKEYNFNKICNLNLPSLEYLEIDGNASTIDSLMPIISGKSFPNLVYLGIINGGDSEEIIQYITKSPLIENLKVLNLSGGNLHNIENLDLRELSPLNRLHTLNLSENSLRTSMIEQLSKLKCRLIAESQGNYYRYDSLWE
ncbi:MAG: hypothetical protein QNJ47_03685 [Nostocaceae cyanobacterium]|nr:hypothetical protein [Nostocaceae cyanobacterium]